MRDFPVKAAASLQTYWAWLQQKSEGIGDLGPEWKSQRRRGAILADLGSQRFPGSSKQGLDHLIKPGLGMEAHLAASAALSSPFQMGGTCDADISFCAAALATWGPFLPKWRGRQAKAMRQLQQALEPIEEWAKSMMDEDVAIVANNSHPGFVAALTTCLRWPDRTQALGYVTGMKITEGIQHTGVFRELQSKELREATPDAEYFGAAAVQAVDD